MDDRPKRCECPEQDCLNEKDHQRGQQCEKRAVPDKMATWAGWRKIDGLWHCVSCWSRNFKM